MDLDQAIMAHQQWKTRLNLFLGGNGTETFDPARVGRDDQCELGTWIHGPGQRDFASLPEFAQLVSVHTQFHRSAGEVVTKALAGDKASARALLDGAFHDRSKETAVAILHLKRAVGKAHV